jgi:circadian clock protein KaiB
MQTEQAEQTGVVELRLYVANRTRSKSMRAFTNLTRICDQHLPGRCRIEVIDILKQPDVAKGEQIVAIPTVVRRQPPPVRTVIGDLSNVEITLAGLELQTTHEGADL